MELKLNQGFNITVSDNGEVSVRDTARMVMALAGYSLKNHGDLFDVFAKPVDGETNLLVVYDPAVDIDSLMAEHDAVLYAPLADKSLVQMLMNQHRIHLSSIVTNNGNFVGVWKAERMGDYTSQGAQQDLSVNAEHLTAVSDSAIVAVIQCALQAVGVGRKTFISFDAAGNASLIYRAPENVPALAEYGLGRTIFPASELDEYILVGAPADALNAATAKARSQYDEYQRKEQEEKAAAEVDSQKETAGEAKADASNEAVQQAEADQQAEKTEQPALVDSAAEQPVTDAAALPVDPTPEPEAPKSEPVSEPEAPVSEPETPEPVPAEEVKATESTEQEQPQPQPAETVQTDVQPVTDVKPVDPVQDAPQADSQPAAAE